MLILMTTLSNLVNRGPLSHHLDLLLAQLVLLILVAGVDHLLDQDDHQSLHLAVTFLQSDLNLGPHLNNGEQNYYCGKMANFLLILFVTLFWTSSSH